MAIHTRHGLPRPLLAGTIIVLILLAILYPVLFISAVNDFHGQPLTISLWVEFTTSTGLELGWVRFFEWLALYAIFAWIFLTSLFTLHVPPVKQSTAAGNNA